MLAEEGLRGRLEDVASNAVANPAHRREIASSVKDGDIVASGLSRNEASGRRRSAEEHRALLVRYSDIFRKVILKRLESLAMRCGTRKLLSHPRAP